MQQSEATHTLHYLLYKIYTQQQLNLPWSVALQVKINVQQPSDVRLATVKTLVSRLTRGHLFPPVFRDKVRACFSSQAARNISSQEQEHKAIPPPASDFPSWKLRNYNCPSLAPTVTVEREISGVQSAVLPQLLSSPSSCAGLQVKVQQHVCRYLVPCIEKMKEPE